MKSPAEYERCDRCDLFVRQDCFEKHILHLHDFSPFSGLKAVILSRSVLSDVWLKTTDFAEAVAATSGASVKKCGFGKASSFDRDNENASDLECLVVERNERQPADFLQLAVGFVPSKSRERSIHFVLELPGGSSSRVLSGETTPSAVRVTETVLRMDVWDRERCNDAALFHAQFEFEPDANIAQTLGFLEIP